MSGGDGADRDIGADGATSARRLRSFSRMPPTRPTVEPVDLRIGVVHASLEYAQHTLIAGHYRGAEITGAEASLDARLLGRLSRRHLARLYPEELGESELFDNRLEVGGTDFPRRAMVVGLGPPGELTRTRLTDALAESLLHAALDVADGTPVEEVHQLQVSPMLIGTRGTTPLRVDISVAAIVDAVVAANGRLAELRARDGRRLLCACASTRSSSSSSTLIGPRSPPRGVRHLPTGDEAAGSPRLRPMARLASGQGGWPGQLGVDEDPGWRRIIIGGRRPGGEGTPLELSYTSVGHTSLSAALTIQPNEPVLRALLARVDAATSSVVAPTLLEALVPEALRDDLLVADNIQFIVDDESARFPWEALVIGRQGAAATPAAKRGGLIRQFVHTEGGRRRPRGTEARTAVVIGNPPTDHGPLPGAWDEALSVELLLSDRPNPYSVRMLRWDAAGEPEHDDELDIGDPSARDLPRPDVPASHPAHRCPRGVRRRRRAGRDHRSGRRPAASSGRRRALGDPRDRDAQLLPPRRRSGDGGQPGACLHGAWRASRAGGRMGGRRRSGRSVREELYGELLDGATFGAAVHAARNAAAEVAPESMTWAAYQCYGDPGYRLEAKPRAGSSDDSSISEGELARHIEIAIARAGDVGRTRRPLDDERDHQVGGLVKRLAEAETDDVDEGRRPKLKLTAFAYRERRSPSANSARTTARSTGTGERSRRNGRASRCRHSNSSASMEIRLAQQLHRAGEAHDDLIEASRQHLSAALNVGETGERTRCSAACTRSWPPCGRSRSGRRSWRRRWLRTDGRPSSSTTTTRVSSGSRCTNSRRAAHPSGRPTTRPRSRPGAMPGTSGTGRPSGTPASRT